MKGQNVKGKGGVPLFPARSVLEDDNQRRTHHFIECSHCPEQASVPAGGGSPPGYATLSRRFTRTGWYVGRAPSAHLCPLCNPTKQRAEPVVEQEEPMTTIPEISFADRRIINAKLEEVYENDAVGYRTDWNDEKVAADLGVPFDWVVRQRAENFGPADGNGQMKLLRQDVLDLEQKLIRWTNEGELLASNMADLLAKMH